MEIPIPAKNIFIWKRDPIWRIFPWCHVGVMASPNYDIWTVCWTPCQTNNNENITAVYYWSFVSGIHQWPVDSPHKGPVIQRGCPCRDVIMFLCTISYIHVVCSEAVRAILDVCIKHLQLNTISVVRRNEPAVVHATEKQNKFYIIITVMWRVLVGVPNHRQLNCFINNKRLRRTAKSSSKVRSRDIIMCVLVAYHNGDQSPSRCGCVFKCVITMTS